MPYAYAELHADAQALERYETAIANFQTADADIDATIAAIRAGQAGRRPDEPQSGRRDGLVPDLPRPAADAARAHLLTPVIAGNEFQEALQELPRPAVPDAQPGRVARQPGRVRRHARHAPPGASPSACRASASRPGSRSTSSALGKRSDANAAELKQAEDAADGVAFADVKRTRAAAAPAARHRHAGRLRPTPTPWREAHDRLRRVAGALAWQLAHEYPARSGTRRRASSRPRPSWPTRDARRRALAQAQRDEPVRFDGFARRIAELDARLNVLIPRVAALAPEQQAALQEIAIVELTARRSAWPPTPRRRASPSRSCTTAPRNPGGRPCGKP